MKGEEAKIGTRLHAVRSPSRATLLFAAVCLILHTRVDAAQYTFTKIATVKGDFSDLFGAGINDQGQVSFADTPAATGVFGVYVGDENSLKKITDENNGQFSTFFKTGINNSGTVVFGAGLMSGNAVYVGNGQAITPIAAYGPDWAGIGGAPAINDLGYVAFIGIPRTSAVAIFTSGGGTVTKLALPTGFAGNGSDLSINNAGTVAYYVNLSSGGHSVVAANANSVVTIAQTGQTFRDVGESAAIDDTGTVVFTGIRSADDLSGVFTGDGQTTTTVADSSGMYATFVNPAINAGGHVAFLAYLKPGGSGIFTGPDASSDRVIRTGDPLLGSTVDNVWFASNGLNDEGAIAFFAHLTDGENVIARADPIPEPNLSILLGAIPSLLLLRRRPSHQ